MSEHPAPASGQPAGLRARIGTTNNLDVNDGWIGLLSSFSDVLDGADPERTRIRLRQVKQQFGDLVVHAEPISDPEAAAVFEKAVARAQADASRTCEECGATGTVHVRPNDWLAVLCDLHAFRHDPAHDLYDCVVNMVDPLTKDQERDLRDTLNALLALEDRTSSVETGQSAGGRVYRWLAQANETLDGQEPLELIIADPRRVLDAAEDHQPGN